MTKLFDKGLYRLGLRRTKVAGMFSGVVCIVGSALVPLINMISGSRYTHNNFDVHFYSYAVLLWALIALAPIIMYTAFSFLTNRRDSDFYHSLPHKRITLYLSLFAAAMTWIWGILLATVAICGALWLVAGTSLSVSLTWATLGQTLLCFSVATLCTAAFIPASLAATGTTISAIALYGCVMLVPKLAIFVFSTCLTEFAPFIYVSEQVQQYFAFGLFHTLAMLCGDYSPLPLIYTIVLALAHIALGLIIFCRRHSESAGTPAPGKWLQTLYRSLIAVPTMLLLVYAAFMDSDISLLMVLVVVTVVIYYLYELITTKKIRSMLAATATLWILPAFCLVFGGSIWLSGTVSWACTPTEVENIDHIRIAQSVQLIDDGSDILEYYKLAELPIYDEDIITVTTELLKYEHKEAYRGSNYNYALVELTTTSGRTVLRKLYPVHTNYRDYYEYYYDEKNGVWGQGGSEAPHLPYGLSSLEGIISPELLAENSVLTCLLDLVHSYGAERGVDRSLDSDNVKYYFTSLFGSESGYCMYINDRGGSNKYIVCHYFYTDDSRMMEELLQCYIAEFNSLSEDERRQLCSTSKPRTVGGIFIDAEQLAQRSWNYPLISSYITLAVDDEMTPRSSELLRRLYEKAEVDTSIDTTVELAEVE